MSSKKINYLVKGNSKLKKDGYHSFSLPAGSTCPFKGDCFNYCYARGGRYQFQNVQNAYNRNFELSKGKDFVNVIVSEINRRPSVHTIRLHTSGDFYNKAYYNKWMEIARQVPHVRIYAYTKSLPYIDYDNMPDNVTIIQSVGGRLEIDKSKKHADIFLTEQDVIKAGYDLCPHDSDSIVFETDKIGLAIHGELKGNFTG